MIFGGKNTKWSIFLLLCVCLVILPTKAKAEPTACWPDYPAKGQAISGFPDKSGFQSSSCVAKKEDCDVKKGFAVDGYNCTGSATFCCLEPKKLGDCYNNYTGADRPQIKSTTCVKDKEACGASPNRPLGDGYGCSEDAKVCCAIMDPSKTKQGASAIPDTGSTAEWKLQNDEGTGLLLVECTKTGNCEIADLVNQGINFAKWMMGLSGALFLIVFVYGGAMYLASFGRSDYVKKGQSAMVRGAFGIILVMGAWTIVSYVAASLGYAVGGSAVGGGGSKGVCGTATGTEGKQCFDTKNDAGKFESGSCDAGYCPGAKEIQCCKPKSGT